MEEYITPEQLCDIIPGTTKNYWAQLRFVGNGPQYLKPTPRKVLYVKSHVAEWLDGSARYGTHPDKAVG